MVISKLEYTGKQNISIGRSTYKIFWHTPLWDPILLFSHTFLLKSTYIGGPFPPPKQVHTPLWEILDLPLISISRISHRGVWTCLGGMDLQCRGFSVKMYVKTKELGPIGGVCQKILYVDLPMEMFCFPVYSNLLITIQCQPTKYYSDPPSVTIDSHRPPHPYHTIPYHPTLYYPTSPTHRDKVVQECLIFHGLLHIV